MQAMILGNLVKIIVNMLTPDLMKKFADMVLDFAEDFVIGTKSSVDDGIVLPICQSIRKAFNIPDND